MAFSGVQYSVPASVALEFTVLPISDSPKTTVFETDFKVSIVQIYERRSAVRPNDRQRRFCCVRSCLSTTLSTVTSTVSSFDRLDVDELIKRAIMHSRRENTMRWINASSFYSNRIFECCHGGCILNNDIPGDRCYGSRPRHWNMLTLYGSHTRHHTWQSRISEWLLLVSKVRKLKSTKIWDGSLR